MCFVLTDDNSLILLIFQSQVDVVRLKWETSLALGDIGVLLQP